GVGAGALPADAMQQRLRRVSARDLLIETLPLRARKTPPARAGWRVLQKTSHQPFRLSQAAACRERELNDRELRDGIRVVAPPAALSQRRGQQAEPLVVANRRRPNARALRENADGHG